MNVFGNPKFTHRIFGKLHMLTILEKTGSEKTAAIRRMKSWKSWICDQYIYKKTRNGILVICNNTNTTPATFWWTCCHRWNWNPWEQHNDPTCIRWCGSDNFSIFRQFILCDNGKGIAHGVATCCGTRYRFPFFWLLVVIARPAVLVEVQLQLFVEVGEVDKDLPAFPLRIVKHCAVEVFARVQAIWWDDLDTNSYSVRCLP